LQFRALSLGVEHFTDMLVFLLVNTATTFELATVQSLVLPKRWIRLEPQTKAGDH